MGKEKIRIGLYLEREAIEACDKFLQQTNARSRNEFVTAAIRFYIGYLSAEGMEDFLLQSLAKVIQATVHDSENRMARMDFKIAVALYELTQVIAYIYGGIDDETLRRLHIRSIEEVKRINGTLRYDDAVKFQMGEE